MKVWHNSLKERFIEFPVHQHLLMICNELNRAGNLLNDTQEYKNCLERALELLDYSVNSGVWRTKYKEILRARGLIAHLYVSPPSKTKDLQKILISLNTEAFQIVNGKL